MFADNMMYLIERRIICGSEGYSLVLLPVLANQARFFALSFYSVNWFVYDVLFVYTSNEVVFQTVEINSP